MLHVQKETLDHLKEAVAVFATDGKLRLFNPAFARIWHLEAADLGSEPHIDEVIVRMRALLDDDSIWTRVKRAVTDFAEAREPSGGQLVRTDDTIIDYALLPLPDGATLLSFADVTDSKRIERVLTEHNEALVAADRLKSQFISHVSYELRTPLQSISGFAELLSSPRTGLLTERQRDYLAAILSSSDTLKTIINGIIDLATIDAGALALNPASIGVREVLESVAKSTRERFARASQKLEITIGDDVARIVADKERLVQVLQNLLANASGFSAQGKAVRLACRLEGQHVIFEVEDEGVGIPKEEQPKVFERFVTRTGGAGHRGAGLGLPLVKSLVELHGGTVALESEPGRGTRVIVKLPQHGKSRALAPVADPSRSNDDRRDGVAAA
jgi:signal transduction histidine kinase